MNILYIDTQKYNIEEAITIHNKLKDTLDDDLITLPMNTLLLLDVGLDRLYSLRSIINSVIEVKENGTNS